MVREGHPAQCSVNFTNKLLKISVINPLPDSGYDRICEGKNTPINIKLSCSETLGCKQLWSKFKTLVLQLQIFQIFFVIKNLGMDPYIQIHDAHNQTHEDDFNTKR